MKRILLLALQCVLFANFSCFAKTLNPVTSNGVKVIDVKTRNSILSKQVEKNEKDKITFLKFQGIGSKDNFGGASNIILDEKDEKILKTLPNIQTIELELRPGSWGLSENVTMRSTYPKVQNLVLDIYDNVSNQTLTPTTFEEISGLTGEQEDIAKKLQRYLDKFPNLQSVILNFGVPTNLPFSLKEDTYALWLNPKYFNNSNGLGWGSYIMPSKGMVLFVKNQSPNFKNDPTIIPPKAFLKREAVGNDFIIGENIKYIGKHGLDVDAKFAPSNQVLYINDISLNGSTEIDRPLIIYDDVYLGYKIPKIVFKKPVELYTNFTGTEPQEIIFEDVLTANMGVFSQLKDGVKRIDFKKVPNIRGGYTNWGETIIDIPEGTIDQFVAMGFPKKNINAISSAPIELVLDTPNSLLSHISIDKLKNIEILKIIGFLYDTEIKILSRECKNIKQLDLSQAIITTSPETQKEVEENNAAIAAIFGLMAEAGKQQYQEGKISRESMELTSMIAEDLSSLNSNNVKKAIDYCYIPENAFMGLKYLQSVKLPLTASSIREGAFMNCPSLKEVEFPPYLKSIRRFAFSYTGLERVKLPATVYDISDYRNDNCAFGHCKNLKMLDCGDCKFKDTVWECPLYGGDGLILPQNITIIKKLSLNNGATLYCPPTLKDFAQYGGIRDLSIYVQSNIAANNTYGVYDCTFYVPKSGMTSWYAQYGQRNKIEENKMPSVYK